MTLTEAMQQLHRLLEEIGRDLPKAEKGNKEAAQRVRTRTIQLEKVAKMYRKESLLAAKPASKVSASKKAEEKQKPKTLTKVSTIEMAVPLKRATAKLPSKKR